MLVEAFAQSRQSESRNARGGELERERDAVETTADRGRRGDLFRSAHPRAERSALQKQIERGIRATTVFERGVHRRRGKRRQPIHGFAGDAEALAAGREHCYDAGHACNTADSVATATAGMTCSQLSTSSNYASAQLRSE